MESWTIHTFLPESSTQPFSSFCQPIGLKNQNAFLFTSLFLVVAIFRQRLWWKIGRFLSKVSGVQQKLRCMYFSGISFRGEMYPGNLWIPETIGVLFGKRVLPASNIPRFFVTSTVIHYLKQIRGEGFFSPNVPNKVTWKIKHIIEWSVLFLPQSWFSGKWVHFQHDGSNGSNLISSNDFQAL